MNKQIVVAANLSRPRPTPESRRRFLKGTIVLTGMLATGSILAAVAPSRAWALEATMLNQQQATTLLSMARHMFPHKDLPDAVYALLVKDIDEACTDAAVRTLIGDGIKNLDAVAGGSWTNAPAEQQLSMLKNISADPFFQKIRGQCVVSLYDNQMAYQHFGYEGEAWSKGGYLGRGFDDLLWLPNPPQAASPSSMIG